jgi:hypothetical protein
MGFIDTCETFILSEDRMFSYCTPFVFLEVFGINTDYLPGVALLNNRHKLYSSLPSIRYRLATVGEA